MRTAIIALAFGWGCLGGYLAWLVNHPIVDQEATPGEQALEEIWMTKAWRDQKGQKVP